MSRNQRVALIVAAVAVAVVAFLVVQPDGADDEPERAGRTDSASPRTETGPAGTSTQPTAKPRVEGIAMASGSPRGGPRSLRYTKGDLVRIVVTSDAQDEIHIHGYDLTRSPGPGKPARFSFDADIEGVFEIESHVAKDAGKDALVARLVVEP